MKEDAIYLASLEINYKACGIVGRGPDMEDKETQLILNQKHGGGMPRKVINLPKRCSQLCEHSVLNKDSIQSSPKRIIRRIFRE